MAAGYLWLQIVKQWCVKTMATFQECMTGLYNIYCLFIQGCILNVIIAIEYHEGAAG